MDGVGSNLKSLLQSASLEVPFFQRPYVWDDSHFESLIESLNESPSNKMPFFGSLILKEKGEEDSEKYLVIDGQQRCMTFYIMIRAILDVCENSKELSHTQLARLTDCVYNVTNDSSGNEHYITRLLPSNPDQKSFNFIMNVSSRPQLDKINPESSIECAYLYFYTYFSKNKDQIKATTSRILSDNKCIIKITLTANDDEQKIFDSVNSMGKTLSNADIIKNYIFQKIKSNNTTKEDNDKLIDAYNKYWDSVFYENEKKEFWYQDFTVGRIKTDNLECFLKDFAIVKKFYGAKSFSGTHGLCSAYKKEVNTKTKPELYSFLKDIHDYACVYYQYKTEYENQSDFVWSDYKNRLLLILDNLDTTTFNPYVLKVLKESPNSAEEKFFNLEKFLLQRFIFDGTTKNYNQCCEKLLAVPNDKAYLSEYMEESPTTNESYKVKFRKLNNSQARLILFLVEMLLRKGDESKFNDTLKIDKFSLEHIMPQKWQAAWMTVASYDENGKLVPTSNIDLFNRNREEAVKSIGNFALLSSKLNSSISNANFETKINGKVASNKGGIKKYASSLITTQCIIEAYEKDKVWNEKNIFAREKEYFNKLNEAYKFVENRKGKK